MRDVPYISFFYILIVSENSEMGRGWSDGVTRGVFIWDQNFPVMLLLLLMLLWPSSPSYCTLRNNIAKSRYAILGPYLERP